jgi:CheY-like chemotaxis protein
LNEANIGNPVVVFASAAAARHHLLTRPSEAPALLVLDIHLQGPDTGLDLLRWVRSQPPPLGITPVIMLTGSGETDHQLTSRGLGILEFLHKPVTHAHLAAAVQALGFEILTDALTGRLWFRIRARLPDVDDPNELPVVTRWTRVHTNGWTAEAWLARDGRYCHRTYESPFIPGDEPESKPGLEAAEAAADAAVPAHVCDCPPWEAQRWKDRPGT